MNRQTEPVDPQTYLTKPLEQWTLRELTDALGMRTSAQVLRTPEGNVRVMRWRKTATIERMQALQAAVREDESFYRKTLVERLTQRQAAPAVSA